MLRNDENLLVLIECRKLSVSDIKNAEAKMKIVRASQRLVFDHGLKLTTLKT